METEPARAAAVHNHRGRDYYFCSADCEAKFLENPDRYAQSSDPVVGSLPTGYTRAPPGDRALRELPGVVEANVNLSTDSAQLRYVPGQVSFAEVQAAIQSTGYEVARPVGGAGGGDEE